METNDGVPMKEPVKGDLDDRGLGFPGERGGGTMIAGSTQRKIDGLWVERWRR